MTDGQSSISREEAREALGRSGYLIESRAESKLINAGYYVEANASFPDPRTGTSRELDIFAMGAENAGPDELDYLFPVLLMECINNPEPLVLLSKEAQVPFLYHHEVRFSGLPVKVPAGPDEWESIADRLKLGRFHHYCRPSVATQYCSFTKKKGKQDEWMATHQDDQFDAFRKLCDAVDYYAQQHFDDYMLGDDPEHVNVQVYYPVLLIQGELLDGRTADSDVLSGVRNTFNSGGQWLPQPHGKITKLMS